MRVWQHAPGLIALFALALGPVTTHAQPATTEEQVTATVGEAGRGAPPAASARRRGILDTLADEPGAGQFGLHRQSDGSFAYTDPHHRFTARVLPDGTVRFADRFRRPSDKNRQHGKCCAKSSAAQDASANPFAGAHVRGPLEWMMRRSKQDPHAAAKAQLLSRTEAFRTRLAIAWHRASLQTRLAALPDELQAIWRSNRPLSARKKMLFARWDECDERFDASPGDVPRSAVVIIDAQRVRTAQQARRSIEAFIRKHLPRKRAGHLTRAELRRFNRTRESQQRFDPYTRGSP